HGAAALLGGGVLMLLLAAWRVVPAEVLTAEMSTLPQAAAPAGRPTLLVLYQPADCQGYADYLRQWNALASEGEVRVVGVPLNVRARRAPGEPAVDFFTPAFPVREELARPAARLLRQMGQSRTPVAVLLDGAGRPRMVVPPGGYAREQVLARMAVRDYARAMFPLPHNRNRR
ncbi:MAG: hypothetical protein ACJ8J0_28390, partial [Longimicrobiaceae bacterium]